MNENTLFIQALKDVIDEDYNADMEAISLNDEHEFSDKHNKKMKKLIIRQSRPYFKLISTAGRRAACVIVATVVLSASALSVDAVRGAVYDFVMENFADHSVIATESGTDDGYPTSIEEKYYISKLPAGFEQTQYGETDNSISVFYSNGKKGILFDQNVKGDHKIYMDNERTDFTKIEIDGQEYLLFESDTDVTCIWDNGRYILSISSNLDKETVIDLCKSTKLQK